MAFFLGLIIGILFGYHYAVHVLKKPYRVILEKNIEAYRKELDRVGRK